MKYKYNRLVYFIKKDIFIFINMNLLDLLYEPYTIILIISIVLTIITYFVVKSDNKDKDEEDQTNMGKSLLYTFLGSFVGITILKFILSYLNQKNAFQKGGVQSVVNNVHDKLTIVADDVDVGFMDT